MSCVGSSTGSCSHQVPILGTANPDKPFLVRQQMATLDPNTEFSHLSRAHPNTQRTAASCQKLLTLLQFGRRNWRNPLSTGDTGSAHGVSDHGGKRLPGARTHPGPNPSTSHECRTWNRTSDLNSKPTTVTLGSFLCSLLQWLLSGNANKPISSLRA